jgi:hypothetical protein
VPCFDIDSADALDYKSQELCLVNINVAPLPASVVPLAFSGFLMNQGKSQGLSVFWEPFQELSDLLFLRAIV